MTENITDKIIDRSKDEDYPFRKRVIDYKKFAKFYFIPILSVFIFGIILIFTVIPSVRYMLDGRDEVKRLEKESDDLDNRIKRLEALRANESENQVLLAKINSLIPSQQSEVVNFRQKVASLGESQGLEVESLRAGETILEEKQNENLTPMQHTFNLIEIPSRFAFSGRFTNFRELLKQLYSGDDFFVVSNMDLDVTTINGANSTWKGEFDLIKYQFAEDNNEQRYLEVSDFSDPNQNVVNFIGENFIEGNL